MDDFDIIQLGFAYDEYQDVVEKLQQELNIWEVGSSASGSLLVTQNNWYWLVDFIWNGADWEYNTNTEDAHVDIKNSKVDKEDLVLLIATEAKRMLSQW